jgi:hypothetical protein
MRSTFRILAALALSANLRVSADTQASIPKMCWAHYVGWGFDQVNGYDRAALDPVWSLKKFNDRSLLGRHVQTDEGVGEGTKLQVRKALQYGIDGFCVDLPIREDSNETFYADALSRFFRAAEGTPFKVALCVDSTAPSVEQMGRAFAALLTRWGSHPNTCLVDGKPVIFIYNSRPRTLADWKAILAALKAQGLEAYWLVQPMGEGTLWEQAPVLAKNLEVFDGLYDFGINGFSPDQMLARLTNGQSALSRHRPGGLLVAGITQGYLGNGNSFYRPYLNTGTLRNNWEAALKADAQWVCITTWNDYVEHTHFEPSVVNRDALLRINRDYVARWRNTPVPPRPPQVFISYHEEVSLGDDWTAEILSLPYHTAPSSVRMRLLGLEGEPAFEPGPVALPPGTIRAETLRVPQIGMDGSRVFRVQVQLVSAAATNEWRELYPVVVRPGPLASLRTIRIPLDELAATPTLTLQAAQGKREALIRFTRWSLAGKVELLRNGWPVAETEIAHKRAPSVTVRLPLPGTDATPADLFIARYSTLDGDVAWSAPCFAPAHAHTGAADTQPVIVTGSDFDEGWWGGTVSRLDKPLVVKLPLHAEEAFALTYPMAEGAGETLPSASGWQIPLVLGRHHIYMQKNPEWVPRWETSDKGLPALHFDGSNNCAILPSRTLPYGPLTVEFNVRPELKGAAMTLFSDTCGVSLTLTPDAHVVFARKKDAVASRRALGAGRWAHLAAVYDGEQLRLYLDGALDNEAPAEAQVVRINSLPVIGNNQAGNAGFSGLIGGFHLQCGVLPPERFVLRRR